MAEHLQANDPLEVKLASELLGTEHICKDCKDGQSKYTIYLKWLEENNSYLFFTGENLFFRKPIIYKVDKERKYLQKDLVNGEHKSLQNLRNQERNWLREFKMLDTRDQEVVSSLSCNLNRKNHYIWNKWMERPMWKKIENARAKMEVPE